MIGVGKIATWLIGRGLAKTVPGAEKAATWIVRLALAVLLLAVLALGKCAYDRQVVAKHEAEVRADRAEDSLEGRVRADQGEEEARTKFDQEQDELKRKSDDEIRKDPEGAGKPVGPGQRGYFDSLPNDGGS